MTKQKSERTAAEIRELRIANLEKARAVRTANLGPRSEKVRVKKTEEELKEIRKNAAKKAAETRRLNKLKKEKELEEIIEIKDE